MSSVEEVVKAHPHPTATDRALLLRAAEALFDCEESCTACADACLGEEMVQSLRRCIRICLDCADSCAATHRLVLRQTESDSTVLRRQLEACATICRLCAEECERHATHHAHCRLCAQSCRRCEQACGQLAGAVAG
ncbi:four-helix bundle copper-binding protein [Candidatus Methylocalor cossyra]|uniref:Ferredoxin n=1 Tax=Candidatus Methylocalor cossyra TaxID=3108543 RepID=A0ABP1C6V8_9GAMM